MRRPPFVWTAHAARSRSDRASSTASRSPIRSSRRRSSACSAPTASWSCTRCCWRCVVWCGYLFLHARMRAATVGAARRRVRDGVGRAGLLRLDHAGAVQLRARPAWRTSAGSTRKWRRPSARRAGMRWLFRPRATSWRRSCSASRRSRSRERAAVPADPGVAGCGSGAGARSLVGRRAVRRCAPAACSRVNMAISGEWNYQGGGSAHVRLRSSRSRRQRRAFEVGHAEGARRGADRRHLQPPRVLDQPDAQPRVLLRRPLRRAGRRTSSRRCSRCSRSSPAPRRRPLWQWLVLAAGAGADPDLHHQHAVHLDRRRRVGRQPLLHGRLRRVPVPAAADVARRGSRSCRGSSAACSSRSWC